MVSCGLSLINRRPKQLHQIPFVLFKQVPASSKALLYLLLLFAASCVQNRKVVLLQKNDLHTKDIVLDSVIRKYPAQTFDYKIQPNDLLYIDIKSLTNQEIDVFNKITAGNAAMQNPMMMAQGPGSLIFGYLVDDAGFVDVILEGKVKLGGKTIFEAEQHLSGIVKKYNDDPLVKIRLLNNRFTVLGEVNKEGTIQISNNRISLMEAIGLSGGFGELADRSKVKLIRQDANGTSVQYLNFLDENLMNSPYFYVNQNDVLVVPPLKQRPFRRYFGQNYSLFVTTISTTVLIITLLFR